MTAAQAWWRARGYKVAPRFRKVGANAAQMAPGGGRGPPLRQFRDSYELGAQRVVYGVATAMLPDLRFEVPWVGTCGLGWAGRKGCGTRGRSAEQEEHGGPSALVLGGAGPMQSRGTAPSPVQRPRLIWCRAAVPAPRAALASAPRPADLVIPLLQPGAGAFTASGRRPVEAASSV